MWLDHTAVKLMVQSSDFITYYHQSVLSSTYWVLAHELWDYPFELIFCFICRFNFIPLPPWPCSQKIKGWYDMRYYRPMWKFVKTPRIFHAKHSDQNKTDCRYNYLIILFLIPNPLCSHPFYTFNYGTAAMKRRLPKNSINNDYRKKPTNSNPRNYDNDVTNRINGSIWEEWIK